MLGKRGATIVAIDAAVTPRDKLAAGIDAYLATIEANPGLYRFVDRRLDSEREGGAGSVSGRGRLPAASQR